MTKKLLYFGLIVVFSLFSGAAFAHGENENEIENEIENEVEVEHGIEAEHCPGGGKILMGNVSITPPAGAVAGSFSMDFRNDDCRPEMENEVENEIEREHMNGHVHSSGQFEINDDNSISIANMTSTSNNITVTNAAGGSFTVNCTKTVNGKLNPNGTEFEGEIEVQCSSSGKMKKGLDDLLLEVAPHL